jgi:hypothetical protein
MSEPPPRRSRAPLERESTVVSPCQLSQVARLEQVEGRATGVRAQAAKGGIEVEFHRENTNRFVTIALTEENGASVTHHKSPLVGARLRAYIEIKNRNARSSDQSRKTARPTQRTSV